MEGVIKTLPKAKAKALVMRRTERSEKVTVSLKARSAVCLRAKARTETRSSSADLAPTKNRVAETDIVPQLYRKGESKFVKRYRKKKHTQTSNLGAIDGATTQTRERDLLSERCLDRLELRQLQEDTSRSGCRYID